MNWYNRIVILIGMFFLFHFQLSGQVAESKAKAVMIERLTRFIEWAPQSELADTESHFVIKIIGRDPFEGLLEQVYKTNQIKSLDVKIEFIDRQEEIDACHLLFIGQMPSGRLSGLMEFLCDKAILTISDSPGYAERGVMINIILVNQKMKFEINESSVQQSGLKCNYLLKNQAIHLYH